MPDQRLTSRLLRLLFSIVLGLCLAGCQTPPESSEMLAAIDESSPSDIYHLRVGDIIQVDVFQEPGMTTRQRVQGDGTISVGLIGRVRVLGESVEQAADRISKLLDKKYLINPQVNVTVLAYSPRRFTVWGQVQRPGSYVIPPEQQVSLPEAIAMAGGNSNIGNLRKVFVSRKKDGGVKRIRIDALSPTAQYFDVREGDVIFVTETIF
jgi:polysaccharide export outer membrane protein